MAQWNPKGYGVGSNLIRTDRVEGCQIEMKESCVCGREPITTSQLFPEQWRIIVGLAQLEKQNMA